MSGKQVYLTAKELELLYDVVERGIGTYEYSGDTELEKELEEKRENGLDSALEKLFNLII